LEVIEMKDPMDRLELLAKAARHEQAPSTDVSRKVMDAISDGVLEEDVSLNWIAAAAAVAAAVAILALVPAYLDWSDPLIALVANLSWGLL